MKTIFKRVSKSTLAIVLTICMLISCMTVGLIATDAAKVSKDESVGYGSATLYYTTESSGTWSGESTQSISLSSDSGSATVTLSASTTYRFIIVGDNNDWWGNNSFGTISNSSTERTLAKFSNFSTGNNVTSNPNTLTTSSAGSYKFAVSFSGSTCTCTVSRPTWTIAGSSATIFGTAWAPTATANDMSDPDGDGTYTKVYENVTETATFQFKIAQDHAWDTAYPSQNFSITYSNDNSDSRTVSASGNTMYWKSGDTLTFTFNSSTHDITVTSVTPENKYNVTISAGEGGEVSPSGLQANVGVDTGLSVTARPSTGYSFSGWTKTAVTTTNDNATTTVKPTNADVTHTLVANFTPNNYTVTYGSADHGTFTVKKTSDNTAVTSGSEVPYNTGITVTASPAQYYVLSSVTYTDADGNTTTATGEGNTRTFNVPAANTTITVTFAGQDNAISTSVNPEDGYGLVWVGATASTAYADRLTNYKTGDTVYLRASANPGYEFTKFVVTYADGTTEDVTTNNSSLTVSTTTFDQSDNGAITVVGYFEKADLTVVKGTQSNGTFTVSKGSTVITTTGTAQIGDKITISVAPANGYEVTSVTYNDGTDHDADPDGDNYSFTMPGYNVTVNVTFSKATYSVTAVSSPSVGGTLYVKGSDSVGTDTSFNYTIESSGTLNFKAKANAAYDLTSVTVRFSDGTADAVYTVAGNTVTDNTEKATGISLTGHYGNISVTAVFTKKPTHTITVKTNNVAYGTATASVGEAYDGQSVTLTASENTGTFSSWTVNSGGVSVADDDSASTTFTMGSADVLITATFAEYTANSNFYYNAYDNSGFIANKYGKRMTEAMIGGSKYSYYLVSDRSETDQNFTLSYGNLDYTTKRLYFQASTDYGDGWDTRDEEQFAMFLASDQSVIQVWTMMERCSNLDHTDNHKKGYQITVPDGAKYAYVKCGGDKNKQTVRIDLNTRENGGNNAIYLGTWNDSYKQYEINYFYNNDGQGLIGDIDEKFKSSNLYTDDFGTRGFGEYTINRLNSSSSVVPKPAQNLSSGDDYYILYLYNGGTYTINGITKTLTKNEVIWLPSLPPAIPDNTETVDIYAKNGTLRDSTFNRFTNLANTDIVADYFEYSEVLDSGVYTYTSTADYNAAHPSKRIDITNDQSGYNSNYAIMTNVPIGAKIKLRTTLKATVESNDGSFDNKAFKTTHYLKAYSFNGMTYELHTPEDDGIYEEIWTVRDVNTKSADGTENLTKDGKAVEITPIYYMKDNTNCKTFYIDGYDGTVQNAWGNMLCVYPYYEGLSNKDNAFGGYPGQPMLFWGGKYQMEIPLTVDGTASGATVKGLTLHNSYWDLLHRSLDIRCNARNHAQTYDYDDFYKLYKEKNPDTIIFDFKYRDTYDNFAADGEAEAAHKTYDSEDDYKVYDFAAVGSSRPAKSADDFDDADKNGVELVTDYYGRQVDAFGTLIADANKSDYDTTGIQDKELLFVSTGFRWTYVGEYATLWAVYAPQSEIPDVEEGDTKDTAGKFIGYISSSMLYLNNWDRRLQYTGGDSTADGRMSWSEFEKTYNWLKKYYTGVPALISYEKEIWNDSKDKAYRSDGKWYYSNKGDQIEANIIIQYNDNVATSADIVASKDKALSDTSKWTTDAFSNVAGVGGQNNIGSTTECAAYFTNTSPNLLGKVNSGTQFADSTKSFTFRADAGGSYMFVNWVRLSNGKYYEISEKELAESVMSSNDTYIARFVRSASGSLKISHVVEQNGTYKGTGTPTVTVTVSNGSGTQVFTDSSSDGTPIDISSYVQTKYSAYTVNISLSTTPDEDCTLHDISTTAAQKYQPGSILNNATTVQQFTIDNIINDDVSTLRYVSHLTKTVFHYNYEITYTYYSRFWGEQSYTQTGECEDGDFTGSKTGATLTTDFIIGKTPYEKNFRQQINWNYTNSAVASAGGTNDHGAAAMQNNAATAVAGQDNTYKMTAHVYASNTVNDKVTAEFVLPYKYNDKNSGYTVQATDVYTAGGTKSGSSYLYNTGNESVTLTTSAYKLFTYDDIIHSGSDNELASSLPLMEAPEYLWMDEDSTNKVQYHTKPGESKRYYTGNSFTVNGTTYYMRSKPDGSAAGANEVIITDEMGVSDAYTVKFKKRKNETQYGGNGNETTYHFAVSSGTRGTSDFKVYFFAYAMDNNENPELDQDKYVFNGQYIVFSETDEKDGIIENTGVKKYFTRWDIFNTKGTLIASCYNRRFNFSGYDNYVIRPVYESAEPNHYASSTETGLIPTISYLDDSRNQWNKGGSGDYASVTQQTDLTAADKIFTDFAITYRYNGLNINTVPNRATDSTNGADIKIGLVIERLDELDTVGGKYVTDVSYYANKYKNDNDWTRLATPLAGTGTGLTDAVKNGDNNNKHTCYNSKIGANVAEFGTLFGQPAPGAVDGQGSVIDNFNRLQWFYTINNFGSAINMKNYAYRAIPYMIVTDSSGTTTAYLTSSPAYFTIYDTAAREHN